VVRVAEAVGVRMNARLLAWEGRCQRHPVVAQDINDYVRERTWGEFTAKDFRAL
jgi:DNA topoisomerase-1